MHITILICGSFNYSKLDLFQSCFLLLFLSDCMEAKEEMKVEPILGIPVVSSTNVREFRTYQKYQIRIPSGLQAGDAVYIQLIPSNETLKVVIPEDAYDAFHIEVLPDGHNYKYIEAPVLQFPQPTVRRMQRRIEDSLSVVWALH